MFAVPGNYRRLFRIIGWIYFIRAIVEGSIRQLVELVLVIQILLPLVFLKVHQEICWVVLHLVMY